MLVIVLGILLLVISPSAPCWVSVRFGLCSGMTSMCPLLLLLVAVAQNQARKLSPVKMSAEVPAQPVAKRVKTDWLAEGGMRSIPTPASIALLIYA